MAKVVVIGRNYTSRLGMIRAVGRAGHQVFVICTNKSKSDGIDKVSRYVSGYYSAKEPNRDLLLRTLDSIANSEQEKMVLIPVDDYAASTIDENIDRLKGRFLFPNINMQQGAINKLMDKNLQKALARESGLNVAEGWTIEIKDHKYSLPENIKYPCFPKPQVSFKGNKRCMRRCNDETELRMVLDEVARERECPVLIEQYIEIDKEYGVLGMCAKGKSILPGLVDKILIGNGGHKGVTKVGVVTPLENNPQLKKLIKFFLEKTQFTGLCDIDLYDSNGIIYFNELNLRFGAFGYAIFCAGINLPNSLISTLQGDTIDLEPVNIRSKTTCLSEKVNFEDFIAGYYGWKEYRRIHEMADFTFLADPTDPKPHRQFMKHAFMSILKRYIKKFF